jgi:hypothetical protein
MIFWKEYWFRSLAWSCSGWIMIKYTTLVRHRDAAGSRILRIPASAPALAKNFSSLRLQLWLHNTELLSAPFLAFFLEIFLALIKPFLLQFPLGLLSFLLCLSNFPFFSTPFSYFFPPNGIGWYFPGPPGGGGGRGSSCFTDRYSWSEQNNYSLN